MGYIDYSEGEALLGETHSTNSKACKKRIGSWGRAGKVVVALVAFVAAGGILTLVLSNRHIASQVEYVKESITDYAIGLVGEPSTFECSGHGVITSKGGCLCDLGYNGTFCSETHTTSSHLSVQNPKSICLIVENFGNMGDARDGRGLSNAELAISMKRKGYDVTVLYVGSDNSLFQRMADKFAARKVSLLRLPSTGLNYGESKSIETRAYEVYQYLLHTPAFGKVIFSASSGTAYYALQAQKQGLLCTETRFIVNMDVLPRGSIERIESGDSDYHPVAADTLKYDFMTQKSVELADTIVFTSSLLSDEVKEEGWEIKTSDIHVIPSLPPQWKVPEQYRSTQNSVKEIVYIGPLTVSGGLQVFCDALDVIAQQVASNGIKVTFLGFSSSVLDMTSEEYIELRALSWESYDLQWSIQSADGLKNILSYMTPSDMDKLAVVPSEFDAYAGIPQMLYYSGVPFIGSSMSAIRELIDIADQTRMISNPDGVELSSKITKVINGASAISKPRSEPKAIFSKWIEILEAKPSTKKCVTAYDELTEKPLVSVVIVHHNRHKFLRQAIESITAQTYKNIEVILVDDGSTDPESIEYITELSWKWWEEKGWKILREPNRYLGAARNTGSRSASGRYVLFLDDDDYSKPHHIETLVRAAINTGADVTTAGHDTFSGLRLPKSSKPAERYIPIGKAKLVGMLENVFGDSSMMVKRDYFVASGGFTEDVGVGFEDYEYFAKLSLTNSTLEAVAEPLHWYRRHSRTMSSKTNLKSNQLRMLRPYLTARAITTPEERAVLEHTQTLFFERHGISSAEERALFREAQSNVTDPTLPRPRPPPVQIDCSAYLDTSGASGYKFNTVKSWVDSKEAWCWDFGTRSTLSDKKDTAALIIPMLLPVYPDRRPAGKPVIASIPCQAGYSDAFAIIEVVVAAGDEFDKFRDYTSLFLGSPLNQFFQQDKFYNFPVVPPGSSLNNVSPNTGLTLPPMKEAWFEKKIVYYYDLGAIPNLPITAGSALTSTAVDVLKNGQAFGSPVLQFGSDKSSGFYGLKFFDASGLVDYKEDTFKSITQLGTPFRPYDQGRVWNCPVVFTSTTVSSIESERTELRLDGLEPAVVPGLPSVKVVLKGSGFTGQNIVYINQAAVPSTNVTVLSSTAIAVDLNAAAFPGTNGLVSVYVDDSLPYDLYYYNAKAEIKSVSAMDKLYTLAADQIVSIYGQFLSDFPDAVCVFNTTTEGVSTTLTVENSTYASCPLPLVEESAVYTVNVLFSKPKFDVPINKLSIPTESEDLNREELFVPLSTNVTNALRVVAPPPKIVYAEFTESGGSIYVVFDNPVSVIDYNAYQSSKVINIRDTEEPFPCSWVFVTNPQGGNVVPGKLSRDGSDEDCLVYMLSSSEMLLELSSDFTSSDKAAVAPLRRIFVREGALWYEGAEFSESVASFTTVQPPEEIETPVIEINAPLYIPACSDIVLDLSETTGSLGRLFLSGQVSYSTTTPLPQAQNQAVNSSLVAGMNSILAGNSTTITIPSSALWTPPGADFLTYAFTVQFVNFMNKAGSATVLVNRLNDNSAPYIVVDEPNGTPQAGEAITVVASALTVCNIREAMSYRWTVQNCPGLTIASSFSNPELYIAPFTIPPATKCDLRVEAKYSKDALWRSYPISFTTRRDVLTVSPGSSRTVRADQQVVIEADIDSDSQSTLPSTLKCTWVCIVGGGLCNPNINAKLTGCRNNVIPAGLLAPQTYNFTVSVTNSATGSTARGRVGSLIRVVANQVPAVTIKATEVFPSANSDTFALTAELASSSVSSISSLVYKWSNCAIDPKVEKIDRIDFNRTSAFLSDVRSRELRTLKFAQGTLTAKGRYCISVAVTDGTSNGFAEYRFSTRSAPESGFCQMTTGSQYRCNGFTTDPQSFPLYYTFFVRSGNDQPWSLAQPRSTVSVFDAALLAASSFQIQARVSDASGSIGRWNKVDSVAGFRLRKRQSCTTATCILNQATLNYQLTKNVAAAERALGIASLSIKSGDADFASALSLITSIANDVTVDTQVHGPFLVNVLSNIVGSGYGIQRSDWTSVIKLARQLIVSIKASGKMESPSNCVGPSSSTQLLSIVDQIFGASLVNTPGDAGKKDLLTQLSDILGQVETCAARKKAAQETPLTFSSRYIGRKIGVAYTDIASSYCSFSVGANQIDTSLQTVTYGCGSFDLQIYPNISSIAESNPVVNDIDLWDVRQENALGLRSNSFIVSSVPIDNAFDAKFKLSTYVIPDPDNANAIDYSKNKYPDQSFRPECSTFDLGKQEWSSDSCVPQRIANTTVACKCNRIASIGLTAKLIPPPDVGVLSTTSNIGAIVGGTIAALFVIAAIIAAVYYLRKKGTSKKSSRKSSKKEPTLPTTAPPPAALSKQMSKKESKIEKSQIASRISDTTPGRTAEDLEIVVDTRAAPTVAAARKSRGPLPAYVRPPSYEEHLARRGRK